MYCIKTEYNNSPKKIDTNLDKRNKHWGTDIIDLCYQLRNGVSQKGTKIVKLEDSLYHTPGKKTLTKKRRPAKMRNTRSNEGERRRNWGGKFGDIRG